MIPSQEAGALLAIVEGVKLDGKIPLTCDTILEYVRMYSKWSLYTLE